jgi:hypothetical protein
LWALALLLAILNAAMFIESASVGLPPISFLGSILSWAILAVWWVRASGAWAYSPRCRSHGHDAS